MDKKKVIVLLFLVLITCGCFKNNKLNNEIIENQGKIINNLKNSKDDVVVYFSNNQKEDCFYVFKENNNSYVQYLYIFHNSKKLYDEYVAKYLLESSYSLKTQEEAYLTIVVLNKGRLNNQSLENFVKEKYKDKKYHII